MSRELKRAPWTPQEDDRLRRFVARYGPNHWSTAARPAVAGHHVHQGSLALLPRPRHQAEEEEIIRLHAIHGNNWFDIAWKLPGRTSKDVRDHWREHLNQRLVAQGIDPRTHNKPLAVAETSTSQSQTPSRAQMMVTGETVPLQPAQPSPSSAAPEAGDDDSGGNRRVV